MVNILLNRNEYAKPCLLSGFYSYCFCRITCFHDCLGKQIECNGYLIIQNWSFNFWSFNDHSSRSFSNEHLHRPGEYVASVPRGSRSYEWKWHGFLEYFFWCYSNSLKGKYHYFYISRNTYIQEQKENNAGGFKVRQKYCTFRDALS